MIYVVIAVFLIFLASFLPRMLPITFIRKKIKSRFIKSFLFYVPYAVLASITFPYILYVSDNIYISLAGMMVAIILSLMNQKMVIVAISSVLFVFLLLLL